nr:hypothetical protein [Halomonas organivorans]
MAIQLALWPLLGPIAAGAVAVALLLGREIGQHEYRLGLERGWQWGDPLPVRWHEGVWRGWTRDSAIDVAAPVGATSLAVLIACLM